MAKKSSSQLIVLSLLAIVSLALYLGYNLPNRWQYALENRALSLIAIVITGAAIALATMIFQTVVNNRILTPSILGLDSLYLLIQTTIIFLFGSSTLLSMNSIALFVLCTGLMMAFSLVLYHFLFKKENQNIFFLLLVGIIFGTFFGSLTTFMEVLREYFIFIEDILRYRNLSAFSDAENIIRSFLRFFQSIFPISSVR